MVIGDDGLTVLPSMFSLVASTTPLRSIQSTRGYVLRVPGAVLVSTYRRSESPPRRPRTYVQPTKQQVAAAVFV